jgi:transposase
MPEQAPDYVGLDVAQARLDYCLNEHEEEGCENNAEGRHQLIARLKGLARPRVVCEASGGYEKMIVAELLGAGIEVCVVQPGRVRAFAYAEGLLAKTDRIDARLLRRFGQAVTLRLAEPVEPVAGTLRELLEHRRQLTEQLSELEGRLALAGATLKKLLHQQRAFLQQQIKTVEKMIDEHIDHHPTLRDKAARLQQLKGVGPVLAATLLAYVPELGRIASAKLSALIGVAPHPDRLRSNRKASPRSWRPRPSASRPLHGRDRRRALQSHPGRVLSTPQSSRQTLQGLHRRRYAQNTLCTQSLDRKSSLRSCTITPLLRG